MSQAEPIRAAGCLLWRATGATVEIALVHRPRRDDWSLPKGKLAKREGWPAAAVREVVEETGYPVVLGPPLPTQHYRVDGAPKTVRYWMARAGDGSFAPNVEVDTLVWLAASEARDRLSYRHDTDVVDAFLATRRLVRGRDPDLLAVLRHTQAVARATWSEADRLRPLTPRGVEAADALVPTLLAFGVGSIHSSDATRAMDTLAPFAAATGQYVIEEPALSEEAYRDEPVAAAERIKGLLRGGGRTVVCSHRPVIPTLLAAAVGVEAAESLLGAGLPPGGVVLIHHLGGEVVATERHDPDR